ncbi:MAG: hypothetical protein LBM01_01655 [Christensenellaceae bacterium]|jgi:hypothetical protein|nr:hypothetical protein [Christensenellaceae bacterium]
MGMKIRNFCAEELRRQGFSNDEIDAKLEETLERANKVEDHQFTKMKKMFKTKPAPKVQRELDKALLTEAGIAK